MLASMPAQTPPIDSSLHDAGPEASRQRPEQGIQGKTGPQGPKGAAGEAAIIIGYFENRDPSELPSSGYIPANWDSQGNPQTGEQLAHSRRVH